MDDAAHHIIIGGGQAAAWIARTLRAEGDQAPITLLAAEPHAPYERPPLSKAHLQGQPVPLTLLDQAGAAALAIALHLNTTATRIDPATRTVETTTRTAERHTLRYTTLFIATGARPRTIWPPHPRLHTLRTRDDADRLRTALLSSRHLVIIGGGWIGLEVAATARAIGVEVTVLEAAPTLCARSVPPPVSAWLAATHRAQAVDIRLNQSVAAVAPGPAGVRIETADGDLDADHVLVAIGVDPETTLAEQAGLACDNGILVDAQGRTADPHIFAAGDVTRHPNTFARSTIRQESWANAQNQAITAARAALGHPGTYDEPPWLWSDQYDNTIQILGNPAQATRTFRHANGQACWLMHGADGSMVGAVAVNAPRDFRTLKKLAASGEAPSLETWSDLAPSLAKARTA